jgi:uncharacterized protein YktA (UPF0223 family)
MPRTRSTPSKYWNVREAVKELPFLQSIQSAYDQGFRRIVVYGNYTDSEVEQTVSLIYRHGNSHTECLQLFIDSSD